MLVNARKPEVILAEAEISLFVVRSRKEFFALRVDAIVSNTEVVVKQWPALLPKVEFMLGMSILPTGKAVFVLSLNQLVDSIHLGQMRVERLNRENDHVAA